MLELLLGWFLPDVWVLSVHWLLLRLLLSELWGDLLHNLRGRLFLLKQHLKHKLFKLPIGSLPGRFRFKQLFLMRCEHLRGCIGIVGLQRVFGWGTECLRRIGMQRLPRRLLRIIGL